MPTVQEFREMFPEFDEVLYPEARVNFALLRAERMLSIERWGDWWDDAVCLVAAHRLVIGQAALQSKNGTGGMDAAAGPVVSETKSVGGVSKSQSRAGTATANPAAMDWNLSVYGQEYWRQAQLIGMGGVVV